MPALIIYEPGRPSRVFILRKARSLVGSGMLNDETIRCKGVEPHHVAVEERGGGSWFAVDKTGKGIDVIKLGRAAELGLLDGTEFMIGAARVRFDLAYTHDGVEPAARAGFSGSTAVVTKAGRKKDIDMAGFLVFRDGERRTVDLDCDPFHIGSEPDNNLSLPLKYVSKYHCRLFVRDGAWWIYDCGSTNHTFVDGTKVGAAGLSDCCRIAFGKPEGLFRLKRAGKGRVRIAVFEGMAGNSAPMLEVFSAIRANAKNNFRVLITGETGTGKELVARAIHRQSGRPKDKYLALNCAALPRELAESELFGHAKGAFTGANQARPGAFEATDGGTLFLDEVGELPLDIQVKLLRVLQENEVKPVGQNEAITVDTRVVAATNRDLRKEVAAGKFREDLFYRLNVVKISVPALRERMEDLPDIADYMLDEMTEGSIALTDKAKAKLASYDWPGNVRELHSVLSVAWARAKDGEIDAGDLKFESAGLKERANRWKVDFPDMTLVEIQKAVVLATLDELGWDKHKAAKRLGMGHTTLKDKLRAWGYGRDGGKE